MSDNLKDWSIRFSGFKCFSEEPQGIDGLYPLNFFIGRNNSGKSAIIEAIGELCKKNTPHFPGARTGVEPSALFSKKITKEWVEWLTNKEPINRRVPQSVLSSLNSHAGKFFNIRATKGSVDFVPDKNHTFPSHFRQHFDDLTRLLWGAFPTHAMTFQRIAEARNLMAEPMDHSGKVSENGAGATAAVAHVLNAARRNMDLVKRDLRQALNEICQPDAEFVDINTRIVSEESNGLWEILLKEQGKGWIPLSASGSGLKTILLVLIFMFLRPYLDNKSLSDYVLAIEEPENNLHPALQRRLLAYMRQRAVQDGLTVLVATHSAVILDMFAQDKHSKIYRVTQTDGFTQVGNVSDYVQQIAVLDDLEVRASDVLQSNGIIWVEGPSDRLYVNRWIELWTNGELREGAHYQCLPYGGKLLAHLTADPENEELVQILWVNRNAAVLMDRDRPKEEEQLKPAVERIKKEVNDIGGFEWVTRGFEVESYVPDRIYIEIVEDGTKPPDRNKRIGDYLKKHARGTWRSFAKRKVQFAEMVCQKLTREDLNDCLDLATRLEDLCNRVRKWNAMGSKKEDPSPSG